MSSEAAAIVLLCRFEKLGRGGYIEAILPFAAVACMLCNLVLFGIVIFRRYQSYSPNSELVILIQRSGTCSLLLGKEINQQQLALSLKRTREKVPNSEFCIF